MSIALYEMPVSLQVVVEILRQVRFASTGGNASIGTTSQNRSQNTFSVHGPAHTALCERICVCVAACSVLSARSVAEDESPRRHRVTMPRQ